MTKVLSYDPHAGQGHLTYDPHGVRKLQSEPRYACLWTNAGQCIALYN
jgi:hypothetical protein